MNVLNIDALAALKSLDERTVQYLSQALGVSGAIPAYTFVANRFGYDLLGAGAVESFVTFYPVKSPELEGQQNVQSFFYGDCFLSFYMETAPQAGGPWYIKVFADSPHTTAPQEEAELIYYASNLYNPLIRYQVVRLSPPRIPLTSIRVVVYDEGAGLNMALNLRCSFVGLFAPNTNV